MSLTLPSFSAYPLSMRRLVIAAAMMGVSLATTSPAEAKSIWLKCDVLIINLDSQKEKYSLEIEKNGSQYIENANNRIFYGPATFNPGQINFDFRVLDYGDVGDGIKKAVTINRRTLAYTSISVMKITFGGRTDGWVKMKRDPQDDLPESGKCTIIKTPPTTGNKI